VVQKPRYLLHDSPPLVPVLRQMYITCSLQIQIHLNVILPSYLKSYKLPLSYRNRVWFLSLPHVCHMLHPPLLFDLITARLTAAYCEYCQHHYQNYDHCCCSHYYRKSHSMALRPQATDNQLLSIFPAFYLATVECYASFLRITQSKKSWLPGPEDEGQ
jgi:hypothetical protein